MLTLIFSLAISYASAQMVADPLVRIPESCLNQLKLNAGLTSCGNTVADTINTGVLPSSVSEIANDLDNFCSSTCSEALKTLATDLVSPACSDVSSFIQSLQVSASDIPAILILAQEAFCLKDADKYCFPEATNLARTNEGVADPKAFCTNCFIKEYQMVLPNGLASLSPPLQAKLQEQINVVTEAQKHCVGGSYVEIPDSTTAAPDTTTDAPTPTTDAPPPDTTAAPIYNSATPFSILPALVFVVGFF